MKPFGEQKLNNYVCIYFSGGDNKIGVAVRKPDGSVALPYKWQVSQEYMYFKIKVFICMNLVVEYISILGIQNYDDFA